jgi:hypothetical protein
MIVKELDLQKPLYGKTQVISGPTRPNPDKLTLCFLPLRFLLRLALCLWLLKLPALRMVTSVRLSNLWTLSAIGSSH